MGPAIRVEGVGKRYRLGAGTGALIGAQFGHGGGQLVATSVGTLLGAYLGNEAGKSLDRADARSSRRIVSAARQGSVPRRHCVEWFRRRYPGFPFQGRCPG